MNSNQPTNSMAIVMWLDSIGYSHYKDIFTNNGYNEWNMLYNASINDLVSIGIQYLDAVSIKQQLKDLKVLVNKLQNIHQVHNKYNTKPTTSNINGKCNDTRVTRTVSNGINLDNQQVTKVNTCNDPFATNISNTLHTVLTNYLTGIKTNLIDYNNTFSDPLNQINNQIVNHSIIDSKQDNHQLLILMKENVNNIINQQNNMMNNISEYNRKFNDQINGILHKLQSKISSRSSTQQMQQRQSKPVPHGLLLPSNVRDRIQNTDQELCKNKLIGKKRVRGNIQITDNQPYLKKIRLCNGQQISFDTFPNIAVNSSIPPIVATKSISISISNENGHSTSMTND